MQDDKLTITGYTNSTTEKALTYRQPVIDTPSFTMFVFGVMLLTVTAFVLLASNFSAGRHIPATFIVFCCSLFGAILIAWSIYRVRIMLMQVNRDNTETIVNNAAKFLAWQLAGEPTEMRSDTDTTP